MFGIILYLDLLQRIVLKQELKFGTGSIIQQPWNKRPFRF